MKRTAGLIALLVCAMLATAIAVHPPNAGAEGDQDESKDRENDPSVFDLANAAQANSAIVLNQGGGTQADGSDGVEVHVADNFEHQFVFRGTGWAFPDGNRPPLQTADFEISLQAGSEVYSSMLGEITPLSLVPGSPAGLVATATAFVDLDESGAYEPLQDYLIDVTTSTDGTSAAVDFDISVTAPDPVFCSCNPSDPHSVRLWVDTDRATPAGGLGSGDLGTAIALDENGARISTPPGATADLSAIGVVRHEGTAFAQAMWFAEVEGENEFSGWSSARFSTTRDEGRSVAGPTGQFDAALHDNGLVAAYDLCFASVCPIGVDKDVQARMLWTVPEAGPQLAVVLDDPCVATSATAITVGSSETIDLSSCLPANCALSTTLSVQVVDPTIIGNLQVSAAGTVALGGVVTFAPNGLNNANTITVEVSTGNHAVDVFANSGSTGSVQAKVIVLGYYVSPTAPSTCLDGATPLEYHPLPPCAVADTRPTLPTDSPFAGPIEIDNTTAFDVDVVDPISADQIGTGVNAACGIPATADVAVVNVVAIHATSEGGLAVGAGGTVPAEIIVPMTVTEPRLLTNASVTYAPIVDGDISVLPQGTADEEIHFRVVVLGYLDDPAQPGGLRWVPLPAPCAAFDTRNGAGAFAGPRDATADGSVSTEYQISGAFSADQGGTSVTGGVNTDCGVPADAEAVLLNMVAPNATAIGNLRVSDSTNYAGGVLNFDLYTPAFTNSNAIVVPLSASGSVFLQPHCACTATGLTDVRGVVYGYFVS